MGVFCAPRAKDNEIIKAEDFNTGSDCGIGNIVSGLKSILSSGSESFVIGGEVKPYNAGSGTSGLNLIVSQAFIYCGQTGEGLVIDEDYFSDTSKIIGLGTAPKLGKYYTLGVKALEENYDTKARMFNDPAVDAKHQENMEIKKRIIPEFQVKAGDDGSTVAPTLDEGYVKLAEIRLGEGQSDVTEDDIYNITARKPGEANSLWASDQTATYNPSYLAELFGKFLVEHNEDGSHKEGVIKDYNIDFGTGGDGQVNLIDIPLGTSAPTKLHGSLGSSNTNGAAVITNIGQHITDLYLYVDGILRQYSLDTSLNIRAISTENVSTNGIRVVDGESVTEKAIVLLTNQNDKKDNGLYVVSDGAWARAEGYTEGTSLSNHLFYTRYGTNAGKMFYVINAESTLDREDEIEFGEALFTPWATKGTAVFRDENGRFKAAYPSESDDVAIKTNIEELNLKDSQLDEKIDDVEADIKDQIQELEDNTNGATEGLESEIEATNEDLSKLWEYVKNVEDTSLTTDESLQEQIDNIHVKVLLQEPDPIEKGDIWLV